MKATEQYFHVDESLVCGTIQMKAIEQYLHVVLFIMMYKVVPLLSLWMKP